jgi:hypothetical protein
MCMRIYLLFLECVNGPLYYFVLTDLHLQSEGLTRDLPLWSSGLFPFFEYAATSVKVASHSFPSSKHSTPAQPALLNLYDTHYLPLQAGLRHIMKSFILALLPGLEEETGEFFEKV